MDAFEYWTDEDDAEYLQAIQATLSEWESKEDCEGFDELRPEYDFNALGPMVREIYVEALQNKSNCVMLEPDVAKLFSNAEAVNAALRSLVETRSQA